VRHGVLLLDRAEQCHQMIGAIGHIAGAVEVDCQALFRGHLPEIGNVG